MELYTGRKMPVEEIREDLNVCPRSVILPPLQIQIDADRKIY